MIKTILINQMILNGRGAKIDYRCVRERSADLLN